MILQLLAPDDLVRMAQQEFEHSKLFGGQGDVVITPHHSVGGWIGTFVVRMVTLDAAALISPTASAASGASTGASTSNSWSPSAV
jgi:hypothetical protein